MNRNSIYIILLLTAIWIVLCENLSALNFLMGLVVSIGCIYFCNKFLPSYKKIANINFLNLLLYLFYLVGQIYLSSFSAIKIILSDARVDIVKVTTQIENDFLRVILANSITLTPGTISLGLKNDEITVLWLREAGVASENIENSGELIKGSLEKTLLKAQKTIIPRS